jgi:hypothetical protein
LRAKSTSLRAAVWANDSLSSADLRYYCFFPRPGFLLLDRIVKTLLNDLGAHIGYEDDGHLVHTDKRTGVQKVSLETWPDVASAKEAVAEKLNKIEWEELKEPPPAA